MYCKENNKQKFLDFGQAWGIELDMNNPLIRVADFIPWEKLEDDYKNYFYLIQVETSFSCRTAFVTLILCAYTKLKDKKLCDAIAENPYYQYFIGITLYTTKRPFSRTTVQNFKKRINPEMVMKINDKLCDYINEKSHNKIEILANTQFCINLENNDDNSDKSTEDIVPEDFNFGTAIMDATCSASYIKYPQDYQLLNDARLLTEKYVDKVSTLNNKEGRKPRTYRRNLNKRYLTISKMKRKNTSDLRSLKLLLLNVITRN